MHVCTLTESAQDKINELCNENSSFAVTLDLKGGGCAGFEYEWGLQKEADPETNDEIIHTGSGNLQIGSYAVMYLIGTEIDYVSQMFGSNFEIRNPNAVSSCGCGVSVNFDMDKMAAE
jgi:iron-sulfur cluster assembly protein